MGYKLKRIMMRPNGVEKQVRPTYTPRTPDASRTLFYYEFEQNLNDSSGNNRTANGSNISYVDVNGQYVVTNSSTSNSYIKPPTISGDGISDFAISFWLMPVTPGNRFVMIFGQSEGTFPYKGPNIFFGPDKYNGQSSFNGFTFRLVGTGQHQSSQVNLNTRHHIVLTRVSGICKAYIDGVEDLSRSDNTTWGTVAANFIFNSNNDSPNQGWGNTGARGDKFIYENVGWSSTDVVNYYNQTKSTYGL